MEWMVMPLHRYADFQGRSRRKEFWMFFLGYSLFFFVADIVGAFLKARSGSLADAYGLMAVVVAIVLLAIAVPALAVHIRRLHDRDHSGWMILLTLIPYVGPIIVFILLCLPGTEGPNRFGPDPIHPDADIRDVFE